jgi:hypothetical protein
VDSGESAQHEDDKLRAAFTVKGLSKETMDAVQAGEVEILDDDPQARILKELGGQT